MRIVFFSDTFLPQINGVATYLTETGRELKKRGHNLLFVVPKTARPVVPPGFAKGDFFYAPSLPARFYPEFRMGNIYSYNLDRALRRFQPEIFHLHTPFTIGFGALLAARRFNRPLVGTYHTFIAGDEAVKYAGFGEGRGGRVFKKILWSYTKLFYNRCDLVLAPTEGTAAILKRNGIKSSLAVLGEGIRLDRIRISDSARCARLRRAYGLDDSRVVVFHGRLSREKNLILSLEVIREVAERVPEVKFLIIGDGPQKKELVEMVKELEIEDKVVFTGFIDHEKLLAEGILSAGDLFLTTSKFETFGLSALEAIASGLPIVAVESQGAAELVEGNGLISSDDRRDLAENVIKILTNREMVARFREVSLKLREKHSVEAVTGELVRHYERVIGNFTPRPRRRLRPNLSDLSKLLGR